MARAKRQIARREAAKEAARGQDRTVATNRRARHEYEILDRIECGIVLHGSEVKSLREGTAQIVEGYARVDDGELWLFQTHIPPWKTGVGFSAHDPDRRRKLLVHRRQIDELLGRTRAQPLTLIPLRVYFHGGTRQGRARPSPRARSSTTGARTWPSATPSATWRARARGAERLRLSHGGVPRHDARRRSARWYARQCGEEPRDTGVNGLDVGSRSGRSEPWSPEPRKRAGTINRRQASACARCLEQRCPSGPSPTDQHLGIMK